MVTIRLFEVRVHAEFAAGDIPGFVHLSASEYVREEASSVGILTQVTDRDAIASTHGSAVHPRPLL